MSSASPLLDSRVTGLAPHFSGKVRDIFDLGDTLLLVATDRISAFDYVLGSGIPDKGKVLTQLSAFWFERTTAIIRNHVVTSNVADFPGELRAHAATLAGRSMLVRKTEPVPLECVARGYLAGSGWKEYLATGQVCGVPLPGGLRESDRLPEPIFTPATKATSGHDINISEADAARLVGSELVNQLRSHTLALYDYGRRHAESRGIILADTKFEFGRLPTGDLILIDEVMTPDSSRYWPAEEYTTGGSPPSYDKQFVRDYMDRVSWDRVSPPPHLPPDVIDSTRARYVEAYELITGESFDEWFTPED